MVTDTTHMIRYHMLIGLPASDTQLSNKFSSMIQGSYSAISI